MFEIMPEVGGLDLPEHRINSKVTPIASIKL